MHIYSTAAGIIEGAHHNHQSLVGTGSSSVEETHH